MNKNHLKFVVKNLHSLFFLVSDILSEKIRAIGYPRFTLWSLKNIVTLPKYTGKVSYLPYKNFDQIEDLNRVDNLTRCSDIPTQIEEIGFDSDTDANETLMLQSTHHPNEYRGRLESWYSVNSKKTAYFSTTDSHYQSVNDANEFNNVCMFGPPSSLPSLISSVPDDWVVIEDEFVMVHATYQTFISTDCHFSPASKLNDAVIWLLIMKGRIGRAELTSFLLRMSNGTHLKTKTHLNKNIQMVACQAFRFEPTDNKGIITVDGEKIKYGPVQGEVIPSLLKVVVPQQKYIPKDV